MAVTSHHRSPRRLCALVAVAGALSLLATACSTHQEAVGNPCRVTKGGKVIAVENRGAIAMAKVGLTPEGLKAQENCK